jgi:hypothetical protein
MNTHDKSLATTGFFLLFCLALQAQIIKVGKPKIFDKDKKEAAPTKQAPQTPAPMQTPSREP